MRYYNVTVIDNVGTEGYTPIHIAAKYNSIDSLKVLLDNHGSTRIYNSNGESPLHTASRLGNVEICKVS